MGIGTQLIVCSVTECTHHDGVRCQLPQIEVSYCDIDPDVHQTKCLNFDKRSECCK